MLLQADARALPLADASVQCVVTSPPYWGLRDYGLPPSVWDDGWRGVLGLEPTPEAYTRHIVEVFREIKRVLRPDGVVWGNWGDSYAGSWGNQGRTEERGTQRPIHGAMMQPVHDGRYPNTQSNTGAVPDGLKPKDLVGIPWRVAFALQADGWTLRADVIWAKPNPMPESVTDRPTKAHEYLFLLAKAERYFYDAEAIKEPATYAGKVVTLGEKSLSRGQAAGAGIAASGNGTAASVVVAAGRNRRSVWTIATEPYPEAHFATFPEALVVPCILAGTSEAGACAVCGAPWERVVTRELVATRGRAHANTRTDPLDSGSQHPWTGGVYGRYDVTTTGWRPTCAHADAPRAPCRVLDPFGGTATVGAVAERLGRRWVATDLKPEYLALAQRRTAQRGLPFLATTDPEGA